MRCVHRQGKLSFGCDIFKLQKSDSFNIIVNFLQLHDFEIIINRLDIELKWTYIYDISVVVFQVENSSDLCATELLKEFELVHVLSIYNMDFIMFLLLN